MGVFKTKRSCLLFLIVVLSLSFCPGHSASPAGTTEITTKQQEVPAGIPQSKGETAPLLDSSPNDTPNNKIPFVEPVGNHGQQSQLGNQQQEEEPNNPLENANQPKAGINQPYSNVNQPYSGTNQPFSTINQPFGATNQPGSLQNAAFANGVSKKNTCIQGVLLVSVLALMICFGIVENSPY